MPHKAAMISVLLKGASAPILALAWLGRQGTRALAVLVFIGIAVPPLGAVCRPFVTEAIFLLLCVSFMRVDIPAVLGHIRKPGLVLTATAWSALAVPLLAGILCRATGFDAQAPGIYLGVVLQSVASPMMAAPALASLIGLDSTIVLITLVTGTALVPFTAPLFSYVFLGGVLTLAPSALGIRLFAILAGSLVVAAAIRRCVGLKAIERHRDPIDGLNILFMLVFVAAVMGTLAGSFMAAPWKSTAVLIFAFAVFWALLAVTLVIFRKCGKKQALALGLMVAERNIGLMLAATQGVLPAGTWLYFALAQFPMYIAPHLLRPMARAQTA